jgi:uronate dehydrogenase
MRVLVTGSSGRIGGVLLEELNRAHEVVGYDRKSPEDLPEGVRFVQGDLLDREALGLAMEGADAVVHLGGIPYDIPPLHEVFSINVQGTYNALELAVERGVGCTPPALWPTVLGKTSTHSIFQSMRSTRCVQTDLMG